MALRIEELTEMVFQDYETQGKRSIRTVKNRAAHLVRLFRRAPKTYDEVESYKATRQREGAAAATIAHELSVLSTGFKIARLRGLVKSIPPIVRPRVDNTRMVTASRAQVEKIIAALEVLDPDVGDVVEWLLAIGWRRGEACRLKWDDVSAGRDRVVLQQFSSKSRKPRDIAIGFKQRAILERRWTKRNGPLVFHRDGKPIAKFRGPWQRACRAAGCPELRPHDLRRVFVRLALDAGVNIDTIMRIAGWSTMSVFLRYAMASSSDQREALDIIFAGGNGGGAAAVS